VPAPKGPPKERLARYHQIKISVIGRKSGQTILIPMRRLSNADCRSNLPGGKRLCPVRNTPQTLVVGGDVLPGPMPRETIACLLDLDIPVQFVQGNGDREVIARMEGTETDWYRTASEQWREPVRWTDQQINPEHKRLLAGWNKTLAVEIGGLGEVLFCHATPRNDSEIFTRLTSEDRLVPVFGRTQRTCRRLWSYPHAI
jgi:hypothetical protein